MRIAALLDPDQLPDVQHRPARCRVRGDQLGDPRVVADAVGDHVLGARESSRVGRRGLIVVRVGVRGGDDTFHTDVLAAQLRRDTAPDILRRYYRDLCIAGGPSLLGKRTVTRRAPGGAAGQHADDH